MLDEYSVRTILNRYFPMATSRAVVDAAHDLALLELLEDDRLVVWEDGLNDRHDPEFIAVTTQSISRRDS